MKIITEEEKLYNEAKTVVLRDKRTSISYLQRKLQIGWNKAVAIMTQLEKNGVVSSPEKDGIRRII